VSLLATSPSATPQPPLRGWLGDAERVDHAVYAAITRTDTPNLDPAMVRLTQAADRSRLWLAIAAVLASTRGARGRRAALTGLTSVALTSAVANLLIKPLSRRRRPVRSEVDPGRQAPMPLSSAFPSGHSASAFAFAGGVGSVLPFDAIPIRALAAVVAYSRVHTGVHYPADAVAGALLGSTLAQVTARTLESWSAGAAREVP